MSAEAEYAYCMLKFSLFFSFLTTIPTVDSLPSEIRKQCNRKRLDKARWIQLKASDSFAKKITEKDNKRLWAEMQTMYKRLNGWDKHEIEEAHIVYVSDYIT